MDDLLLAVATPAVEAPSRRAAQVGSPLTFFAYDKASRVVHGVVLVSCVTAVAETDVVTWTVPRFAAYDNPVQISRDDIQWVQTVVHFKAQAERMLRSSPVLAGGIMNEHFSECTAARWRAWPLQQSEIDRLMQPQDVWVLETSRRMARAVRIEPTVVYAGMTTNKQVLNS